MTDLERALINTGWHKTSIYIFPTENSIKTLYLYLPSRGYDNAQRYAMREWHADMLNLDAAMRKAGYWKELGKWKFNIFSVIPVLPVPEKPIVYGSEGNVRQPTGYVCGRFGIESACPYTNPEACPTIR